MKIALAFDVYGTLIDTAGVVSKLRDIVGDRADAFSQMWREKQLEYSFRHALMRRYVQFSVCVAESLDYVCASLGLTLTSDDKTVLLDAFRVLPAFDDVEACFDALDPAVFDRYALSNGSRDAIEMLLENAGIRDRFVDVVSVDEIGTFKPDPAVYQHFLKRAGIDAENAWLVSGNPFDVIGAMGAGLHGAWVRRSAATVYDPWGIAPTIEIKSLAELEVGLAASGQLTSPPRVQG